MLDVLRRLMVPPIFAGDEEKTRVAVLFNSLLWSFFFTLLAFVCVAVPFVVVQKAAGLLICAVLVGILGGARALLQAGYMQVASLVWLAALWALAVFMALFGGGIRGPGNAFFYPIPVLAGLLLGRGGALTALGVCALTAAGLAGLEALGGLPLQYFPYPLATVWALLLFSMAWTVIPLSVAVRGLRQTLATAREHVAERTRAERNLRQAQGMLTEVLDSVPQSIFWKDRDGVYLGCNRVFAKAAGLEDPRQIVGKTDFDLPWPREEAEAYRADDREVLAANCPKRHINEPLQQADGTRLWIDTTKVPLPDDRGNPRGVLGVYEDITERKRVDEERQALQSQLVRQNQQLEAVRRVSAEITRELDLDNLLRLILQRAVDLVKANGGTILFWDEATQMLVPKLYTENFSGVRLRNVLPGQGLVGRVAASRSGLIVNDYRAWPGALSTGLTRTGVTASMAEPLLYRDSLVGVINVVQTQERATFTEGDASLLRLFATQAAIAIENARLYAAAQRELDERRRAEEALVVRTGHLEAMRTVSEEITRELDLQTLLNLLTRRAVELVGADSGAVHFWDEAGQVVIPKAWQGSLSGWQGGVRYRPGEGVVGTVAQRKEGLIVNDYRRSGYAIPAFVERTTIGAVLAEPLLYQDSLLGVLAITRGEGRPFTADDQGLLRLFATQAAIAIENARLFKDLKQAHGRLQSLAARAAEAEEAERRRLARELHDQVGQNLSALGLNLTMLQAQRGEATDAAFKSRLTDSLTLVERTGAAIRSVMADLRPGVLDDYGLVAALRWLGDEVAARTGIVVDVQGGEQAPRLAAPVENSLFRIAQEALTNVMKHANASEVTVSVDMEDRIVRLLIADNGTGFDAALKGTSQEGYHWGLSAMAERALGIGGRCRVESRPGKGTHVIVEVPL